MKYERTAAFVMKLIAEDRVGSLINYVNLLEESKEGWEKKNQELIEELGKKIVTIPDNPFCKRCWLRKVGLVELEESSGNLIASNGNK